MCSHRQNWDENFQLKQLLAYITADELLVEQITELILEEQDQAHRSNVSTFISDTILVNVQVHYLTSKSIILGVVT